MLQSDFPHLCTLSGSLTNLSSSSATSFKLKWMDFPLFQVHSFASFANTACSFFEAHTKLSIVCIRRNHYIFSSTKLCVCRLTKTIDDNEDPFNDHDDDDDYPQKAACRPQLTQVVPALMQTGRQAVYQPSRWYKLKSWKWSYYQTCKYLSGLKMV